MKFPIKNVFPTSVAPNETMVRPPTSMRINVPDSNNTIFVKIPEKVEKPQPIRGAGDLIAKVAEPIKATLIEHGPEWLREKLKNCNCAERRRILNEMFPLNKGS